jgi:hypothetical protein
MSTASEMLSDQAEQLLSAASYFHIEGDRGRGRPNASAGGNGRAAAGVNGSGNGSLYGNGRAANGGNGREVASPAHRMAPLAKSPGNGAFKSRPLAKPQPRQLVKPRGGNGLKLSMGDEVSDSEFERA